jgi:hypothetical protein
MTSLTPLEWVNLGIMLGLGCTVAWVLWRLVLRPPKHEASRPR